MNPQVCQGCGALLRGKNTRCSSCGNPVTKFSATSVATLTASAPAAVALKENPLQTETMLLGLQVENCPCPVEPVPFPTDVLPYLPFPVDEITFLDETMEQSESWPTVPDPTVEPTGSAGDSPAQENDQVQKHPELVQRTLDQDPVHKDKDPVPIPIPIPIPIPVSIPVKVEPDFILDTVVKPARDFFADSPFNKSQDPPSSRPYADPDPQNIIELISDSGENCRGALPAPGSKDSASPAAQDATDSSKLLQRLIDAQTNGELTEESTFFDHVEKKTRKRTFGKGKDGSTGAEAELQAKATPAKKKIESKYQFNFIQKVSDNLKALLLGSFVLTGVAALIFCFSCFHSEKNPAVTPSTGPAQTVVDGRYSYWFHDAQGRQSQGTFTLQQDGENLVGEGKDLLRRGHANLYDKRPFLLKGSCRNQQVFLDKQYVGRTAVLHYQGGLKAGLPNIEIDGKWSFDTAATSPNQIWHASYLGKRVGNNSKNLLKDFLWNDNEPPAGKFLRILLACIGFGIAIVHLSVKVFGLHGFLNARERRRYITVAARPQHKKFIKEMGKGKGKGSLYIGERADWSLLQLLPKKLYLPASWRLRNPHFLALGAGAKGKTRLLASMAINDIRNNDRAVLVVDSEGSLVELILRWIGSQHDARDLLNRVSLIDPCRSECKLGFNPLAQDNSDNLQSVANAVVMGFKAVYTETQNQQNQWNPQTANILRNAILLLLLNGKSLEDLPTLLSDNDFRDVLLEKVEKNFASQWHTLIAAWSNYKRQARSEQWLSLIEPILNRVQPLLSDSRVSRILNAKGNIVDLNDHIHEKRILLLRVPEGQLEKSGSILGSLMITCLKQAALAQFERTGDAASPSSLYVDSLNNFMDADSFESICADLRKVQIGIHGSLRTFQDLNEEFRNKLPLHLGSLALFSLARKDAEALGPAVFKVDGATNTHVRPEHLVDFTAAPNLRMASEEEKINVSRLVGQDDRSYFFHLLHTEGGIFRMKSPEFKDIARGDVNWDLLESIYDQADSEEEV